MDLTEAFVNAFQQTTLPGVYGGVVSWLFALRMGQFKPETDRATRFMVELAGGGVTATYLSTPLILGLPTPTWCFIVGLSWSLLVGVLRDRSREAFGGPNGLRSQNAPRGDA